MICYYFVKLVYMSAFTCGFRYIYMSLYVVAGWGILMSFLRTLLPSYFEAKSPTDLVWAHQINQSDWPASSRNPLACSPTALGLQIMLFEFWDLNSCLYSWKARTLLTGRCPLLSLYLSYDGLYYKPAINLATKMVFIYTPFSSSSYQNKSSAKCQLSMFCRDTEEDHM